MGLKMIKLKWHGDLPDNIEEIEQKVKIDLVDIHDDLEEEPSALKQESRRTFSICMG